MLAKLAAGALDLIYAPICVCCRGAIPASSRERMVCGVCWARARAIPFPRCERCWTPLPESSPATDLSCRLCPELRPALRAVRSAYVLDGPVRTLVHALKYQGWYSVSLQMGARMAALPWTREVELEARVVVPVPLSKSRARERGYNQAAMLARAFAASRGWTCEENALERARSSGSQTTLHPSERRANVAGAFRTRGEAVSRLEFQHVIVVDDVWTTGATALACGEALLEAGARAFSVLTFARALPELERREKRAELAGIV